MTRAGPSARAGSALAITVGTLLACGGALRPVRTVSLRPVTSVAVDTSPKASPRLMPAEAFIRSYLDLFGALGPLDTQARARGAQGGQLFDTWTDYLAALGLPDYRTDIPRGVQTNALMLAAFERLGIALCDRAVESDLRPRPPVAASRRALFTFDLPPGTGIDLAATEFAPRFEVLHRRFLGYPAALAPDGRTMRFLGLYNTIARRHVLTTRPGFSPAEAGWAAVCYGLVRHPEFQFY